jgi:hypothetical protein
MDSVGKIPQGRAPWQSIPLTTRAIIRMIASLAKEAAGRSETRTQSLLPNRFLNL